MKNFFAVFLILVVSLVLFGCVDENPPVNKPVLNDSNATAEGVNAVVNANNKFAFEVFDKLKNDTSSNGNVFVSPWSISSALTMTYEGAKGKTAEEMQNVLHFPKDIAVRGPAYAKIFNSMNASGKSYILSTANALWAQKDYVFLKEYFDTVVQYYGGKVTNLDFVTDTENSRQTINKWVEDNTNNKIKDLIPTGVLDQYTRLVLTNAVYFKGEWFTQFDKKNTQNREFKILQDNVIQTPMMSMSSEGLKEAKFKYFEDEKLQVLELPYKGEEISTVLLLPKENNLDSIKEYLDSEKFSELEKSLSETKMDSVSIPKFKFETKYNMKETLASMGMPAAFIPPVNSNGADFSGMTGAKDLIIRQVIHQTFVEVNEEGTEAAAATAVEFGTTSIRTDPKVFNADHPFIFIIKENNTGNILFLGKVLNPSK